MCEGCNSIVHQSNMRIGALDSIKWFKNVKSCLIDGKAVVFCNKCDKEVGMTDSLIFPFKVKEPSISYSIFDWQSEQLEKEKEKISIGVYNGVRTKKIEELLTKLMYLKCQRYQATIVQLRKKIDIFQAAFKNSILIINILKEK